MWIWEITSPLLLLFYWYRNASGRGGWLRNSFNWLDFRRWFVAIGVMVHLSILVLMDVGPFSLVAMAYYPCLFHPDEWRRGAGRFSRGHDSC